MVENKHTGRANHYARQVVAGKIPACQWVRLACQRHLDDLKKSKTAAFKFRFDPAKAEKICNFIELLPHVKGQWAGSTITLEPWQEFSLCCVFGWVHKKTGLRRFREMYLEVPRKNAKSVLAAGIGLYMLTEDGEAGAEVYSGATTEKQAWEVFRPAKLMAEKAEGFRDHYGVEINAKNINVMDTASRFEPVIGSPGDGASPHCAIIDEFHEHLKPDLYDTMATGMGARLQPLIVIITTAGTNLAGPCYDKRDHVAKILSGALKNDSIFGIIYTIDDADKWQDAKNWRKANPNYGVSVSAEYLEAQRKTALQRVSRQNILRCKLLNQWLNAGTAWLDMTAWHENATPLTLADFEGETALAAVDLASKIDLAVLLLMFHRAGRYYVFINCYLPEDALDLPENSHYAGWAKEGFLTLTHGAIIDYDYIEEDLKAYRGRFEIVELIYDPFQATQFATRMMAEGFTVVELGATVKNFSEPMKEVESLVLARKFHHPANPVLTWMASNVVAYTDRKDNIFPRKDHVSKKIDGIVAAIMAMARAMVIDYQAAGSIYEDRGIMIL